MRIAYFDCFSGISGDMTIAAFLDAGLKFETFSRELAKLKLKGYKLRKSKVTRGEVAGTKFDCISSVDPRGHRSLESIISIIDKSALNKKVKDTAKEIFNTMAAAETKVHGKAGAKDVIFHELGDIDSIIDIVGTAIAIDQLGIDAVYSSKVSLGRAIVRSRHGNIPVPSPASLELLKGFPVSVTDIEAELVTPTGAGILKTLARSTAAVPQMTISKIGYGAGSKQIGERPNMLRILIGEAAHSFKEDTVYVVETNIDDMNPQHIGYAVEKVMRSGALDAYITNIQMKKSRPAFKLTAITDLARLNDVAAAIFGETSSIGLRFYEANRIKLDRRSSMVKTDYGEVKVKVSKGPGGLLTVSPEHDECVEKARINNIPLRKVYEAAKISARGFFLSAAAAIFLSISLAVPYAISDTIVKSDGSELKGIVVEDYRDRVVFSTMNGEKMIMKSDIRELYYDEEEANLIKLAEQASDKRDYIKALTYYVMAFKINPESKAAKDGIVFLEGYLFRKEQALKEEEVRKRDEFERHGPTVPQIGQAGEEEIAEKSARLKKALGMGLAVKNGLPVVEFVQANSPAADAGVEKGDRLIAIWARLTGYMDLGEVLDALLDKPSLELKCAIEKTVAAEDVLKGASFVMEFDGLTVSAVRPASAAAKSGLKKGDLVTAIDGKSTRYMPLKNAIDVMKRSKEGAVELTIRRETLMWRRE
ncbi:MAG: nickel pincer cofactor biosynthesis protein LarC [Candidatus Omnitrophica bacterium]|nr:nickel pincer cofactor biosynthesis protein LarC [Candidatus Omnitrophota bacterium]